MPQSPNIGQNSHGDISDFWIFGQSLKKENCHNSRISNNIDIKLISLTKLDKGNMTTSKFDNGVISVNCDVNSVFQFMDNLEQFGSRIPDAWSIKLTYSLIVSFCLTKPENRTKKSLKQFSKYCFDGR